jgi:hypothetical protein
LYVTERIPRDKHGATVESSWEADLLAGALMELSSRFNSLQRDIGYVDYRGQLPDRTLDPDIGGGMGNIARGQQFVGANDADAAIRNSIERVASRFGLTVDSVTIFHALGAAPAVVLTTPNISTTVAKYQSLENALFGTRPRYEGFFVEIRGENGKTYARRSLSLLTGTGAVWTAPSLGG